MQEKRFAADYLVFRCLAGSFAYGTNLPSSDRDERGVFIAPPSHILSCVQKVEQVEEDSEDTVIFELRKFMKLAADCNPNIIELLATDEKNILFCDWPFKEVRENIALFISKKVRYTFSGFAISQLKRIQGHHRWIGLQTRGVKKLQELFNEKKINLDWLNDHFPAYIVAQVMKNRFPQDGQTYCHGKYLLDEEIGTLSLHQPQLANFCRFIGLDGQVVKNADFLRSIQKSCFLAETFGTTQFRVYRSPHFFREKLGFFTPNETQPKWVNIDDTTLKSRAEFMGMLWVNTEEFKAQHKQWKQYHEWKKNRNPQRAELEEKMGFDSKHALHLVRLIRMCKEILSGQGIIVHRPDAAELLRIRQGDFDYDWLINIADNMDKELNELYERSELPHSADKAAIDALYRSIVLRYWKEKKLL